MKIKETLQNYRRVLMVAKKPSRDEFFFAARICAMGMVAIGLIGFIFYLMSIVIG